MNKHRPQLYRDFVSGFLLLPTGDRHPAHQTPHCPLLDVAKHYEARRGVATLNIAGITAHQELGRLESVKRLAPAKSAESRFPAAAVQRDHSSRSA